MTAQDRGTHAAESPAPQPPNAEPEAGAVSDPNPQGVAPVLAGTSDIDYSVPAVIPDDDALSRLDWHMRMIRVRTTELHDVDRLYNAEMARIKDRHQNRRRIIQNAIDWHSAPIRSYHLAHLDERTIEMPHGTSKVTVPVKPKVFMDGEQSDVVTEWARTAHPEIMKGPNVTDVRRVVDIKDHKDGTFTVVDPTTGEVVPGVTAQIPQPSWSLDIEPGSPF